MRPESFDSAGATGLDTYSTWNPRPSKVNVPTVESESAKHNEIRDVEAYEASKSEGRYRADTVLCNQTAPA